jgi:hypothetical protein
MKSYIFSSPQSVGQVVNITYYPTVGSPVDLGVQTLPFTWETPDAYGVFEIYFIATQQTCYIENLEV